MLNEIPQNREITGRNPDGTFPKGISGNPGGRPKGGLKDYDRQKFVAMSDEQKEEFLQKIAPELRYRMAEGNPATATDITSKGLPIIQLATEVIDKNDINISTEPNSEGQTSL